MARLSDPGLTMTFNHNGHYCVEVKFSLDAPLFVLADRLIKLLEQPGLTPAELQQLTDRLNAHDEQLKGMTNEPSPAT